MRPTPRTAAGVLPGAMILALTPAMAGAALAAPLAAPSPGAQAPVAVAVPKATFTPARFQPGDNLTVTVTGCDGAPHTGFAADSNQLFHETPAFERDGDRWQAIGATKADLRTGQSYRTRFRCQVGDTTAQFPLTVKVQAPSPSPTPTPTFRFDFDKVELSTRRVTAGGEMKFTVTCPTSVTAESAAFAQAPEFEETETGTFEGTAEFKATLPSVVTIKVICADHGFVTYSTRPGDDDISNGGPTVPSGAPNTGGGPAADTGVPGPLVLGGAALLLALAGFGTWTAARRQQAPGDA
jgi:hypothetical protein